TFGGTQGAYDSGPAQFDASLARFVVGHFTRTGGAQQLAALYQSPNAKAKLLLFDPTPNGLVLMKNNLYETNEGEYDLSRASIGAAEETVCPRWPLTGMPLVGGSASKRPLYVKIDNNPHARPHYGITKADQVYEWLVEGLTTRLAAVFQSKDPDVIGSVRSARMTDTPVIPSLGAAFVYSGGGPEELMKIHYDAAVVDRYIDLAPGYGWGYRVGF